MPQFRDALPQLNGQTVISDGGMETVLLYHKQIDLPEFASYPLVLDDQGQAILSAYMDDYLAIARRHGVPLLAETATWRANRDWVERIGIRGATVADINRRAVDHLVSYREANPDVPQIVSGCIGPRNDGYTPTGVMSADQAEDYHREQVAVLATTEADLVSAYTLNYVEEAVGVARAARAEGIPCVISFTVETDGRLPTGQPLGEAIQQVDAATVCGPAYYMINCAHPSHFSDALNSNALWMNRLRGIRANASMRSHAELDAMTELDEGDPADLGRRMRAIFSRCPQLSVLGGCCGTDHRHIAAIAWECLDTTVVA